jgi:hypothetical protein
MDLRESAGNSGLTRRGVISRVTQAGFWVATGGLWVGKGLAQNAASGITAPGAAASKNPAVPQNVPPVLKGPLSAMGSRFSAPGQERLVIGGNLSGSSVTGATTVTYESPRKFRFQGGGNVIAFDGNAITKNAAKAAADDQLVESLFEDSFDGLIFNLQNATLFRLLMTRARLDDGKAAGYKGPWVDIYQVALPVPSVTGAPIRIKHLYFDSTTNLLDRVRYRTGTSGQTRVETTFQNWKNVNNSLAPQTVARAENGVVQFTLNASGSQTAAAGNAGDFKANDKPGN